MTVRIESAAGFQGGAALSGNARPQQDYKSQDAASTKAQVGSEQAAPPSNPQRVNPVADDGLPDIPKLVGPAAPASLLFEASLAANAEEGEPGHIDFPRMINRRWVPSPDLLRALETIKG
ncbi:hypothetical protein ATL17_0685 [Maritalea mobilis]|uniref:Uncharacterized protein n=1 Tax=Maritalea mobilis TaxID=483324 RepID=A0A4R6VRM7_9HYPH|nr:hypothetical protein [Maritalea mobilis]TDQ66682.1 hypothetical protein ATL17_0685 [Maritalea mobilis]